MNLLPFSVGLLFAAGSFVLLIRSWKSLAAARASRTWPSVVGHVMESDTVRFQSTSGHRTLFVTYTYRVGATQYTGTRSAFYTLQGEEALALGRLLQVSQTVPVFYNPDSPSTATLAVGPRPDKPHSDLALSVLGLVVGLGLALGALAGAIG